MNELTLALTLKVVDQASKEFSKLNSQFESLKTNWAKVGSALAAGVTVAAAGALTAFTGLTKAAINSADEMGKTAQKAGVSVESFSALAYAAELAGVNSQQLQTTFKGLTESLIDSEDKNSRAAKAFKFLGIEVKNADGSLKKADDVLLDIAEAFAKMPDGVEKSALAIDLMKKSGLDMIPMLNTGKAGIEELRAEAEKFGLVISTEQAKQAEQFNDSMTRIGNAASGLGLSLASELLPTLNAVVVEIVNIMKTSPGFQDFARGVGEVFKFIVNAGAGVIFTFKTIGEGLGALGAAAIAFFSGDFAGAGFILKQYIADTKESAARTAEFMAAINKGVPSINASTVALNNASTSIDRYSRSTDKAKKATSEFDKALKALSEKTLSGEVGDALLNETRALEDQVNLMEFELSLYGKTNAERERAIALRKLGIEATLGDTEASKGYLDRLEELVRVREELDELGGLIKDTDIGKTEDLRRKIDLVDRAFFDGINGIKLSAQQYEQIINNLTGKTEEKTEEINEFWRSAAQSMQQNMSSFFFDVMQGRMTDLAASFKSTIDRMVADLLASQLATYLFGDKMGTTGKIGGFIGSFLSTLPTRETGGSMRAGQPYIVGEKRAEVFVPDVNGTIMPNVNSAAGTYTPQPPTNIEVKITAMDSQDVLRALDKIKRPLTDMIQGTQRTYNMRAV